MRKTVLIPHTQTSFSESHRATPRRRAVLGILFVLGIVVGCEELATDTYTVTFNTNGGTAVAVAKVKPGEQVKRPTPDPTKEDNVFLDWYTDQDATQRYDFATPVTKNITLYAGWEAEVVAPTGLTITVEENRSSVAISKTLQFQITPTPAHADADVAWTIADNDPPTNSKGTITVAGLYTAPATRPAPATVTIEATSVVAPMVRAEYVVTIVLPPDRITITGADTVGIATHTQLGITPDPASTYAGVTWRIVDNDNSKGTITAAGIYTAPVSVPAPDTVTIEAVSAVAPEISATHKVTITNFVDIPDANFKAYLKGKFPAAFNSKEKMDGTSFVVTSYAGSIAVSNSNISSLEGIRYFASLISLYCSYNQLTALDLSANTALDTLNCSDNALTALDMRGMRSANALTIDAGENGKNLLTTLNVHDNLKNHDEIKEAKTNRGEAITISTYTTTAAGSTDYMLSCANYDPNVGDNGKCVIKPTSFTVSAAGDASSIFVSKTLQFSITDIAPADAEPGVTWAIANNDANNSKGTITANGLYTAPNAIPTPARVTIEATSTVVSALSATREVTIISNIPDANFRAALQGIIPNAFTGDWLDTTHSDVTGLTSLDVGNSRTPDDKKIFDLRGIEYFTSLTSLYCSGNKLTGLDVSANAVLDTLLCSYNKLTVLDVSANTSLTLLNCSYNQLKVLDFSTNTSLRTLTCNNNRLTGLVLSANTSLRTLACSNNELTGLDVSTNMSLTYLSCSSNQLEVLDVSVNTSLGTLACSDNRLTGLNLSANTSLTYLLCHNNELTDLDMRGMRSATTLRIDAGVNSKNLITTLKVYYDLKDNNEIKEAKTNRGGNITIMTYRAGAGGTVYVEECLDYNPNANTNKCTTP